MISKINISRVLILVFATFTLYSLIVSPSLILLGMLIGFLAYLILTFKLKSLFSYLGLWTIILIQYFIIIYIICYSTYNFYELAGYLFIVIFQTIYCISSQPMFSKLLFTITPFSSK